MDMEKLKEDPIYGKHNSVSTIEQVYVTPLKKEIIAWEGIKKTAEEINYSDLIQQATKTLEEMDDCLQYYESHKHLLAGG